MSHKKLVVINEFELNKMLNIIISSSGISSLQIKERKIRAQLHCIIYGGLGGAKSEILWEVGKNMNKVPTLSFSQANLYGSVDKMTGIHMPPMLWDCRNSVLLLDDFIFNTKNYKSMNILQSLLPLLEFPRIVKRVGYRCNEVNESDGDLHLKVKDGVIDCKTRFSMVMNTMTDLRRKSSEYIDAFASRCIIIPHYPSLDDLKRLARDGTFYEFKKIEVEPHVKIDGKNYSRILNFVESNVKKPDSYLRTVGDCCRVYAVLRRHNEEIYNIIIKLHQRS